MKTIQLYFAAKVVPKKNNFRAAVKKDGTPYQYNVKSRDSEEEIQQEAWTQCVRMGHKPIAKKPVRALFIFDKTTADLIGATETVQDALQGVCYDDDKQIVRQEMFWDSPDNPFLPEGKSYPILPAKHTIYVQLTFAD